MINWKTTLGGSIFGLGTFLMGAGTLAALNSTQFPTKWISGCIFAGFILQGIGGFFTALFARDRNVSDEQAGAGNRPPTPVEVVKPLTPPADGTTKQP